jgi:hypothetical protein
VKLTGTNRPITYTTHHPRKPIQKRFTPRGRYKETRLLASTMWFPNNKPVSHGSLSREQKPQQNNNTTAASLQHVVTRLPTPIFIPGDGTKGYGGHSVGETPGPIPNPEAKTHSADGTAPGRVWESRSPPDTIYDSGPDKECRGLSHLTAESSDIGSIKALSKQ